MTETESHAEGDLPISQVVTALNDMRDALVKISLRLRDAQYEFDVAQRDRAIEDAKEFLVKVQAR